MAYNTELQQWALPQLAHLLPLPEDELKQVVVYVESLSDIETEAHLQDMLGDSAEANQFTTQFIERRNYLHASARKQMSDEKSLLKQQDAAVPTSPGGASSSNGPAKTQDVKGNPPAYAPPRGPPPVNAAGIASARHHTNQVIEAAKVRARDEVRYTPCLD
jgi:hypothetical protein